MWYEVTIASGAGDNRISNSVRQETESLSGVIAEAVAHCSFNNKEDGLLDLLEAVEVFMNDHMIDADLTPEQERLLEVVRSFARLNFQTTPAPQTAPAQ